MNGSVFAAIDEKTRTDLFKRVCLAVLASPFRRRRSWPTAVVILRDDGDRVTDRGSLASWCTANDLPSLAREVLSRRVPPGYVLAYVDAEIGAAAGVRLFLVDVDRECRVVLGGGT